MSEELNYEVIMSDCSDFNYICSSPYMTIKSYASAPAHTIIPYSDFIKQYPKHLIQSGDIVELSDYGLIRVILFNNELCLIDDDTWIPLYNFTDSLESSTPINKIIRPTCNRDLAKLTGTTIWQRKSEAEIKLEEIQSQIEALKKELEEL